MNGLLPRAHVVVKTPNLKISRCRLANYIQKIYYSACRNCNTITFRYSTNHIIDLWRGRYICHLRSLKSQFQVVVKSKCH